MTAGPRGAANSVLTYVAGLLISYICSFIITMLVYNKDELISGDVPDTRREPAEESRQMEADKTLPQKEPEDAALNTDVLYAQYPLVRHGEYILLGETGTSFTYTITDPVGIHARPAAKLAETAKKYDCTITLSAEGRSASAGSMVEMMNLGAVQGTVLKVTAEGREAKEAIRAIKGFLRENI